MVAASKKKSSFFGFLILVITSMSPGLAQNGTVGAPPDSTSTSACEEQSQRILSREDVSAADEAIFSAVDALACEQGNRDNTKILCGVDYEVDAAELFANYQSVCEAAGGVFQVAHTGVACKADGKTEVDHDWLNIPHCVAPNCPLDYAQTNFTSVFFDGYRQSLEVDGYSCKLTSGAGSKNTMPIALWTTAVLVMGGLALMGL